jgi:hypothetical protein
MKKIAYAKWAYKNGHGDISQCFGFFSIPKWKAFLKNPPYTITAFSVDYYDTNCGYFNT